MNEFEVIRIMNKAKIKLLKDKNEDYKNNVVIEKYLEHQDCFFKIDKKIAYKILETVGVNEEQREKVYAKLTCEKMFFDLLQRDIINGDDEELIINYTKSGG